MTTSCSACGHANPADNRFCGNCGSPLTASPPATESERRLVTILFADLAGSTTLGELLDPEEVHELIGTAQAALASTVVQYEGHVVKYLGDGLMALFGAPLAHEDDAERAVLAGLQMHAALASLQPGPSGLALQLRVGITSGEVIAGAIAGTYDVVGDAANTAARLQGAAETGGVLVGEGTTRLAERRVQFGERRELRLKGKAAPVAAYPALGLRERLGERWEIHQRTPFIGREAELAIILHAWEQAQAGRGQLVVLMGEAGIGKSRLVAEAVERLARDEQILRARCLSYGQQISLWLIADLARTLCSLRESDGRERVHSQVLATVGEVLAGEDEGTRSAAADVLGELLGLSPAASPIAGASAQVRHQVLTHSLRLLVKALCFRRPVVLILEDLHWSDTASIALVQELLADVPHLPLLALVTHRLGWTAPWQEWPWPRPLTLAALDERQAARLAGAVLGGTPLAPTLEHYLAERTGGNPFFVEELLRALHDAGELVPRGGHIHLVAGPTGRLPSSLTEVLLARLDRLERQARHVAQVASVIGRSFALQLLAQVAERELATLDHPLAILQRAEIAFPRRGTATEYVFKHATVRDVAYNTLLLRRRRALHAATARAMSRLYPNDDHVETIAYHYAKSEAHEEAATWLERAGDRAASIYANEAALDHYAEARIRVEQAGKEAVALARIDEKSGWILATIGHYDEALTKLEQAAAAYQQTGDHEAEGRAVARIGWTHRERPTPDEGIARIQGFLAARQDDAPLSQSLAHLYTELAFLYLSSGRYEDRLATAVRACELARTVGDKRLLLRAEIIYGIGLTHLGRGQEGLHIMEQAVPLAKSVGDLEALERALMSTGMQYLFGGELRAGKERLAEAVEAGKYLGSPAKLEYALAFLGYCLFCLGDWQAAEAPLHQAIQIARSSGSSWYSPPTLTFLGGLLVARGQWEEAAQCLEEAISLAERSRDVTILPAAHGYLTELSLLRDPASGIALERLEELSSAPGLATTCMLPVLAWAYLEGGEEARAERAIVSALQRASQHGRLLLPDVLRVQGMVQAQQGQWEAAQRSFQAALSSARSMPYPYAEARALYELGSRELQRGEPERARRHLEEAQTIFLRLDAQPYIERTRQTLAALNSLPA